ncbi:MAG: hypothetical protein PHD97_10835, partial [Bacteroidales bacterium]|nr:hypothetical protein [Bacteroidales bacterium]
TSTNDFKLYDKIFHGGKTSLDLEWNKLGANEKWVGMGIGWDQWAGKNLELVEDKTAIRFFIRSSSGKTKNLVIVFLLEDYNGNQCAAVLKDFNYLENKTLDENWNKVTIPFSEFKTNRDKCDFSNIKQLLLQFEVKGHVLIDDMEIVEYGGKKP